MENFSMHFQWQSFSMVWNFMKPPNTIIITILFIFYYTDNHTHRSMVHFIYLLTTCYLVCWWLCVWGSARDQCFFLLTHLSLGKKMNGPNRPRALSQAGQTEPGRQTDTMKAKIIIIISGEIFSAKVVSHKKEEKMNATACSCGSRAKL